VEDLSLGMEGDNRSTKNTDKQIQWRRTKVLELSSQGNTQSDIAKTLQVG
jgi:transcriptional regulator